MADPSVRIPALWRRLAGPVRSAEISPLAAVIAGLGATLFVGEYFRATELSLWWSLGLFFAAGALLGRLRRPSRWIGALAGALAYGALLFSLLPILARVLAHVHELPRWFGWPVVGLMRLLGFDAALSPAWLVRGNAPHEWTEWRWDLVFGQDGVVYRASLNLEKLAPLCALALFGWVCFVAAGKPRWKTRLYSFLTGTLLVLLYLPVRFVLIVLTAWEFGVLDVYWSVLLALVTYLPLVLVLNRWRRWSPGATPRRTESPHVPPAATHARTPGLRRAGGLAAALAGCLGLLLLVVGFFYHPPGELKAGRVLMDDAHSNWEWSDIPFNKEAYTQKAAYNYYCLNRFLDTYFEVGVHHSGPITPEVLADTDILVLKTPTEPYAPEEVETVERFVRDGGALYMLGDHTNLFGMSTFLNEIAGRFGIDFVHDDQFDLLTGQPTIFEKGVAWTHPIVAPMDRFIYETSCTLRCPPGSEVMIGYGMGSEYVDYGHINFFGDIAPQPNERWGAFVQMCAVDAGRGRVVAFADSTVFSNFSMFFDDKPVLALRTVDWLNRRPVITTWTRTAILVAGAALFGLAWLTLLIGGALDRPLGVLAAAVIVGLATYGLDRWSAGVQPYPAPRDPAKVPHYVNFESSFSLAGLPSMLDFSNQADPLAFDAFYVNLQRLELEPYEDNPLGFDRPPVFQMIIHPCIHLIDPGHEHGSHEHEPDDGHHGRSHRLEELAEWVRDGGTLLALGRPGDMYGYEMNELMRLCGVDLEKTKVEVEACLDTDMPHEHLRLPPQPDGAVIPLGEYIDGEIVDVRHGKGRAVFMTYADLFSRKHMGAMYKQPDPHEMALYELQYALIEPLVAGDPLDSERIRQHADRFLELHLEAKEAKEERERQAEQSLTQPASQPTDQPAPTSPEGAQ